MFDKGRRPATNYMRDRQIVEKRRGLYRERERKKNREIRPSQAIKHHWVPIVIRIGGPFFVLLARGKTTGAH